MQKVNIGIIGLGGIGGLLAVLLKNNGHEVFSSRKNKNYRTLILRSNYYGKTRANIKFDKTLKDAKVIFVCSKYPYLKSHLKNIKNTKALIVPFLNGLSHIEILKKKFGNRVLISTIGKVVSKKKIKSNIIMHESKNKPEVLIFLNKSYKNEKKNLLKIFQTIKIKTKIEKNKNKVIWTKLIRLSALSAITSLYNCNLKKIRQNKIKTFELNSLLKESIKLSKKIFKNNYNFKNFKKIIDTFPNELTTSLQRDINSNVSSELETQVGSIIKLSNKYKISSPMYKKIYYKLKKK